MSEINPPRQQVSRFELARTSNHIALSSFGGGLSARSREVLVVEKHWMEEEEFLTAMTMCRILPGANQVNVAVFVGTKMGGILRHAIERGFAPLTVGLILATSLVMSRAADHDWRAYLPTGTCTLIFVFTKTNPLFVVGATALVGCLGVV
ncbi:chromate transporter [Mycobacterium shigaense]|uniref:chromate transporter n=1 Tax=Mycobacterium shigaense TaxID=722731 RepID=UPI000E589BD3|nr:chromate transporter [Mycobacterium shigaense]